MKKVNFQFYNMGPADTQNLHFAKRSSLCFLSKPTSLNSFKFIDRGSVLNVHIDSVCTQFAVGIYFLRSLAKYFPQLRYWWRRVVYRLIDSHISYGVVFLGCSRANNGLLRWFGLQNKTIRLIENINLRLFSTRVKKVVTVTSAEALYYETISFCISKFTMKKGRNIHRFKASYRDNYRPERHKTVLHELFQKIS